MYVAPGTWLLLGGCYLAFRAARHHRLRRARARGDHNDEYEHREGDGSDNGNSNGNGTYGGIDNDGEGDRFLYYGNDDSIEENAVARRSDWEHDLKMRGGYDGGDWVLDANRNRDRSRNGNQDRDLGTKTPDDMASFNDRTAWAPPPPPPRHDSPAGPIHSHPTTTPVITASHSDSDSNSNNSNINSNTPMKTGAAAPPPPPPTLQEENFLDGPSYTWAEDAASSAEVSLADLSDHHLSAAAAVGSSAGGAGPGAVAAAAARAGVQGMAAQGQGKGPHARPRSYEYTKSSGGVEVVGEVVVGEGWRRHTRVYGGGVCLACLESERMREAMGGVGVDARGS